jgi:hypothetical protein
LGGKDDSRGVRREEDTAKETEGEEERQQWK